MAVHFHDPTLLAIGFRHHNRHRVPEALLILSDMLEDSEEYKFSRTRITPQFIKNVLAETRQNQRMASLQGVQVYVIGASAATEAKADEVEKFWVAYLQACGSNFGAENYGSSLIQID